MNEASNRELGPPWPHLRRLVQYARPHWKAMRVSFVVMALNAGCAGLFYGFTPRVIKHIRKDGDFHQLQIALWMLSAIALAKFVTDVANQYLSNRLSQRIVRDLRTDLFAHLHRLSVSFAEGRTTGELMSRLTFDVTNLQNVLVTQVLEGVRSVLMVVAGFAALTYLSWQLTLLALVGVPLFALVIGAASRRARAIAVEVQQQLGAASSHLQEGLSLMRVVQSFGMATREVQRFRAFNETIYKWMMSGIRIQATLTPFVELLGTVGFMTAMLVGGYFVIHGQMEPENMLAFLVTMPGVVSRCKVLSGLRLGCDQAAAAIERVFEILDAKPAVEDRPDARPLPPVRGEVTFDHVGFHYATGDEVLRDVSLTIAPGQVIALVGESGMGKTTITSLLLRLYDVTGGGIRIDGHDLREVTLDSLRRHLGIVPQETMLFSGSVRDNIAFAKPEATDEEIEAVARNANADEFIQALPQGYDTLVGERGAKLSGGQRQRLAIARALLRDPRILILDEATSSLDAASEALVQEALQRLMENRTTIVIAHRFSTIQHADRIVVLGSTTANGHRAGATIVEQGTYSELIALNGSFRKLHDLQTFEA